MTDVATGSRRDLATEILEGIVDLPIISPHGHVPIEQLAGDEGGWTDPARLFVTDDHYVVRMLYSLGVAPEDLGMGRRTPPKRSVAHPRQVWRVFCAHRAAFAATPVGYWLDRSLREVFGLPGWPAEQDADSSFDRISEVLAGSTPMDLLRGQNVTTIATTDASGADLDTHRRLREHGSIPVVVPTFRPDEVIDVADPAWRTHVDLLGARTGSDVSIPEGLILALQSRRAEFRAAGATATDLSTMSASSGRLSRRELRSIWDRASRSDVDDGDAALFAGHMLHEMAAMSVDDGLVMQLHIGALRDHHRAFVRDFGPATGADIPVAVDFTRGLRPLLEEFGAQPGLTLVLFTLDESTYTRELAPLAGHYPALRLGPPWWFLDSPRGIRRFLDAVVETAGVENLAGFNDDTRNVATVAARHGLWRSTVAAWLADGVRDGLVAADLAPVVARRLAFDLARQTYRLDDDSAGRPEGVV